MNLLDSVDWTGTQDYGKWAVEKPGGWVVIAMPGKHAAELARAADRGREDARAHGIDAVEASQAVSTVQKAVDAWMGE